MLFRSGLAMVMTRLAVKDKTFIRANGTKLTAIVRGYDANALYLWAQSMPMPSGYYDYWVYDAERDQFVKRRKSKPEAVDWLESVSWSSNVPIRHAGNDREKRVGHRRLPVDGFSEVEGEPAVVYQYYGCYHHYCRKCAQGKLKKAEAKDIEAHHKNLREIEEYVESLGYALKTKWGCEWKIERRAYVECRKRLEPKFFRKFNEIYRVSAAKMRAAILDGSVFGFCKVDIHTPDHLKEKYADFPPIIKHAEIGREHIGEHMRAYADEHGEMKGKRRNLISSYFGAGIVQMTPMTKFLVEHELVLDKIHYVIQYDESSCFTYFRDEVTENRLRGDGCKVTKNDRGEFVAEKIPEGKSEESALAANTFKLLGNTGYGKMLTNKEKHIDVKYCDYEEAVACSFDPLLKRIKSVAVDCYEVHKFKKKIKMDLPIVIGLAVYCWAKIRMLSFAYDFLGKFLDPSDYEWMETDTDSAYLALSKPSLDEIIKPEMRAEYEAVRREWFANDEDLYSTRKPGLFKTEYESTQMVCLCAKTYIAYDETTDHFKVSTKGLQKRNDKRVDDFTRVLDERVSGSGENFGFRLHPDGRMWTYAQKRLGLSYLYVKRQVLADGIHTVPLDI
jgi:hypothetical protein